MKRLLLVIVALATSLTSCELTEYLFAPQYDNPNDVASETFEGVPYLIAEHPDELDVRGRYDWYNNQWEIQEYVYPFGLVSWSAWPDAQEYRVRYTRLGGSGEREELLNTTVAGGAYSYDGTEIAASIPAGDELFVYVQVKWQDVWWEESWVNLGVKDGSN